MCCAALPSLPSSLEELWCQDNNLTGAQGGAVVWSMLVSGGDCHEPVRMRIPNVRHIERIVQGLERMKLGQQRS